MINISCVCVDATSCDLDGDNVVIYIYMQKWYLYNSLTSLLVMMTNIASRFGICFFMGSCKFDVNLMFDIG